MALLIASYSDNDQILITISRFKINLKGLARLVGGTTSLLVKRKTQIPASNLRDRSTNLSTENVFAAKSFHPKTERERISLSPRFRAIAMTRCVGSNLSNWIDCHRFKRLVLLGIDAVRKPKLDPAG